jgi:hypothetical protein
VYTESLVKTGRSGDTKLNEAEHQRHVRLEPPDESAVAEHYSTPVAASTPPKVLALRTVVSLLAMI